MLGSFPGILSIERFPAVGAWILGEASLIYLRLGLGQDLPDPTSVLSFFFVLFLSFFSLALI